MRNRIFIIIIIVSIGVILFSFKIYPNYILKDLERKVSDIKLPENIEKVAIKSAIGDSGGNGDYSTFRVVMLVKTPIKLDELRQEFKNMDLKFPNHFKVCNNVPIYYITHCESNIFKSSRMFSLKFDELLGVKDYTNYYFVEFIE